MLMPSQNCYRFHPLPANPVCLPVMHPMVTWGRQQLWERSSKENNLACFSAECQEEGAGMKEIRVLFLRAPPRVSRPLQPNSTLHTGAVWLTGGGSGLGKVKAGQDFCTTTLCQLPSPFSQVFYLFFNVLLRDGQT